MFHGWDPPHGIVARRAPLEGRDEDTSASRRPVSPSPAAARLSLPPSPRRGGRGRRPRRRRRAYPELCFCCRVADDRRLVVGFGSRRVSCRSESSFSDRRRRHPTSPACRPRRPVPRLPSRSSIPPFRSSSSSSSSIRGVHLHVGGAASRRAPYPASNFLRNPSALHFATYARIRRNTPEATRLATRELVRPDDRGRSRTSPRWSRPRSRTSLRTGEGSTGNGAATTPPRRRPRRDTEHPRAHDRARAGWRRLWPRRSIRRARRRRRPPLRSGLLVGAVAQRQQRDAGGGWREVPSVRERLHHRAKVPLRGVPEDPEHERDDEAPVFHAGRGARAPMRQAWRTRTLPRELRLGDDPRQARRVVHLQRAPSTSTAPRRRGHSRRRRTTGARAASALSLPVPSISSEPSDAPPATLHRPRTRSPSRTLAPRGRTNGRAAGRSHLIKLAASMVTRASRSRSRWCRAGLDEARKEVGLDLGIGARAAQLARAPRSPRRRRSPRRARARAGATRPAHGFGVERDRTDAAKGQTEQRPRTAASSSEPPRASPIRAEAVTCAPPRERPSCRLTGAAQRRRRARPRRARSCSSQHIPGRAVPGPSPASRARRRGRRQGEHVDGARWR